MKMQMIIKQGIKELVNIEGVLDIQNFTVADTGKVVETEQFLEKLFGFRFHIHIVAGSGPAIVDEFKEQGDSCYEPGETYRIKK